MLRWFLSRLRGARGASWPPPPIRDAKTLERALRAGGMTGDLKALVALGRPSATLNAQPGTAGPPGGCKLGGLPDLPPDMDWPVRPAFRTGPKGDPLAIDLHPAMDRRYLENPQALSFIAQIDFAAINAAVPDDLGLPRRGMLWLFSDAVALFWGVSAGDAPGFRVLYAVDPQDLAPRRPPAEHDPPETYGMVRLVPAPGFDLPPAWGIHFDQLGMSPEFASLYRDLWIDLNAFTNHRAGGWPDPIQNPMEEECALVAAGLDTGEPDTWRSEKARRIRSQPNDWRLLLQIGSDEDAEMMWGDVGTLYLWIRETDLRTARFDRTWLIMQCS